VNLNTTVRVDRSDDRVFPASAESHERLRTIADRANRDD